MKSKTSTFAAPLCMSVLLAACGASDNSSSGSSTTPEPQVPTALAQNLSFSDTDLAREKVAGILSFQAPDSSQDIREYSVYWSDGLSPAGKISTIDAEGILEIHLSADLSPYPFLMVYSENNAGRSTDAALIDLRNDDKGIPSDLARGLGMADSNELAGEVTAKVQWHGAQNEQYVDSYRLYWADENKNRLGEKIIELPSGQGLYQYQIEQNNELAKNLLLVSVNKDGESMESVATPFIDYAPAKSIDLRISEASLAGKLSSAGGETSIGFPFFINGQFIDGLKLDGGIGSPLTGGFDFLSRSSYYSIAHGQVKNTTGNIRYGVVGEYPYRRFIMDFRDIKIGLSQQNSHFQIHLLEQTNAIEIHTAALLGSDLWQGELTQCLRDFIQCTHAGLSDRISITEDISNEAVRLSLGMPELPPTDNVSDLQAAIHENEEGFNLSWQLPEDEGDINHYIIFEVDDQGEFIKQLAVVEKGQTSLAIRFEELSHHASAVSIDSLNTGGYSGLSRHLSLSNLKRSLEFNDIDLTSGQVAGVVTWSGFKPEGTTGYYIYGSADGTNLLTVLAQAPASAASVDLSAVNSQSLSHLFLVAEVNGIEQLQLISRTAVLDKSMQNMVVEFDDTNAEFNKISGTLRINSPQHAVEIIEYRVRWGIDANTRFEDDIILAIPGDAPKFEIQELQVPSNVEYLLISAVLKDGEGAMPYAFEIKDKTPPMLLFRAGNYKGDFAGSSPQQICSEATIPDIVGLPANGVVPFISDELTHLKDRVPEQYRHRNLVGSGEVIAYNWNEIFSEQDISQTIAGAGSDIQTYDYWTGSNDDGTLAEGKHCNNWTGSGRGYYGRPRDKGSFMNSSLSDYGQRCDGGRYTLLCVAY